MKIIEDQQIWFDRVLSYRARIEKDSLIPMINHIKNNMTTLGFRITEDIMFSVYEEISEAENTIIGVEFIVPVDKPFASNCHYVFKPCFRLKNAVMLKYSGKTGELLDTRLRLYEYILGKNITALTNVYYWVKQLSGDSIAADVFLGIDGNSL